METFNFYIKQLRTLADNSEIEQGEILEDVANQLEAWAKNKIIRPKNPFEGIDEILETCPKLPKRQRDKQRARELAIRWQTELFANRNHSWQWCIDWQVRLYRLGQKYGLMREFKNNGIL